MRRKASPGVCRSNYRSDLDVVAARCNDGQRIVPPIHSANRPQSTRVVAPESTGSHMANRPRWSPPRSIAIGRWTRSSGTRRNRSRQCFGSAEILLTGCRHGRRQCLYNHRQQATLLPGPGRNWSGSSPSGPAFLKLERGARMAVQLQSARPGREQHLSLVPTRKGRPDRAATGAASCANRGYVLGLSSMR